MTPQPPKCLSPDCHRAGRRDAAGFLRLCDACEARALKAFAPERAS